ncbi:MAG: metallophosphoesterase family protein [Alphaproteobacteria bacterium]|nr:metallophosphoesterase family protein [Alphaproteobacteria bacterium]
MPRNIIDLGELHDRIVVFGGPYSNLEATEALLKTVDDLGVPRSHVLCTGDMVAYCADPVEVLALLRSSGFGLLLKGNCEEALANNAKDCGCGFDEGSACHRLSKDWYSHAVQSLDDETKQWLAGLPDQAVFNFGGKRFSVVHGGARQNNAFIFETTPHSVKREEIELAGSDAVICGHSGLFFTEVFGEACWHNAGVIGMPANDGTPRVWYSVIDSIPEGIRFSHLPLAYDFKITQEKMRKAGLPEGYASALETGLWPSCDVLTDAEKQKCGVEAVPRQHIWKTV